MEPSTIQVNYMRFHEAMKNPNGVVPTVSGSDRRIGKYPTRKTITQKNSNSHRNSHKIRIPGTECYNLPNLQKVSSSKLRRRQGCQLTESIEHLDVSKFRTPVISLGLVFRATKLTTYQPLAIGSFSCQEYTAEQKLMCRKATERMSW